MAKLSTLPTTRPSSVSGFDQFAYTALSLFDYSSESFSST